MTAVSPKLERRERAIEAARRRIRQLEIETHRVKASLARLEANYEDDVADNLARKLRRRKRAERELNVEDEEWQERFDDAVRFESSSPAIDDGSLHASVALPFTATTNEGAKFVVPPKSRARMDTQAVTGNREPQPRIVSDTAAASAPTAVRIGLHSPAIKRKSAAPLVVSAGIHVALLFFCMTFTYVTFVQERVPLLASPTEPEDLIPVPMAEVKIEPTKFEDDKLENVLAESEVFHLSDSLLDNLVPAEIGAGLQPKGDIGQLESLPTDVGSLMAGGGKPNSGKQGGEIGNAVFFGARSKGDRFVFVIDNSSSMKGGKLEMARAELLRSVESLSAKQSFYVIFVSDKTYPMFYPLLELDMIPATPANKKRLVDWLPNAILASGKNREMIKAMDMAAALRPHAVFLLWDGDMRYSDNVRLDVMTHLTSPTNNWNFVVHTLGMGITSADAEQNLTAIAAARGGLYRRIDIPPAFRK